MNILIIEDDISLWENLRRTFEKNIISNRIKIISSYEDFIRELSIIKSYDIVITDIMLWEWKEKTWIDIINTIRKKNLSMPVVVISSFWELKWLEKAFDTWANDYIIKPFRLKEIELRIYKRFKMYFCSLVYDNSDIISYNWLSYNIGQNDFFYDWKKIELTKKSKYILSIFLSRPEKLIKEDFLKEKIWGDIYDIIERNLRVNILRLKESLKSAWIDSWIENVRWEWYMLRKV